MAVRLVLDIKNISFKICGDLKYQLTIMINLLYPFSSIHNAYNKNKQKASVVQVKCCVSAWICMRGTVGKWTSTAQQCSSGRSGWPWLCTLHRALLARDHTGNDWFKCFRHCKCNAPAPAPSTHRASFMTTLSSFIYTLCVLCTWRQIKAFELGKFIQN